MNVTMSGMPAALSAVPEASILEVDVREDLRNGIEPFSRIMQARATLAPGAVLRVRAIFEPAPLYKVFGRQGLEHWTERLADDDWRVWFYEAAVEAAGDAAAPLPPAPPEPDAVVLDVRGMEPPEPMVATLAALEGLEPGQMLVQVNVRVPQFLLPRLEGLGFTYEVREEADGLVRTFIRRA